MKRNHFIIVGRTSEAIAEGILRDFGQGPGLRVDQPGNVFQSRFGTFGDGESIFELFVEGKLPDHPIAQRLSEPEKHTIAQNLQGAHVTIVHSTSGENTSSRANSLLDGIYDLKHNYRVGSITLVSPHLPFMRNDRRFRKTVHNPDGTTVEMPQRNAVGGRNYARRLRQEGLDRVVALEAHSRDGVQHYRDFFQQENAVFAGRSSVDFINTAEFFAENFARANNIVDANGDWQIACGSPDGLNKPRDYGIMRAKRFALNLYANTKFAGGNLQTPIQELPFMFGIHKERINEKTTEIVNFYGDVAGKDCIIIDDIYSSGGTTIEAAKALKERGAKTVRAIATHGVLVNGALKKMLESAVLDEVHVTDTVTSVNEKAVQYHLLGHPKLFIHSVSPLINEQIERDHKMQDGLDYAYATRGPMPQVG
jgi:phosphoribosylpyrophosphate synthetase